MTYSKELRAVEESADYFESLYMDYFNNFLTVAGFAEYYGWSESKAAQFIGIGRKINHARHSA